MPVVNMQTPGVYIDEENAFPNSVAEVPTAIPAFIGYTAQAAYQGESLLFKAMPVNSMAEFLTFYGSQTAPTATSLGGVNPPSMQYSPVYYPQEATVASAADLHIDGDYYELVPDTTTLYYLYTAMNLFYQNGGGPCYVVSVGGFGKAAGSATKSGPHDVNPNVLLTDLQKGLNVVAEQSEPTMIVVPDSMLLSVTDNATFMTNMLNQCGELQDRVALLDVKGGAQPDPLMWKTDDIDPFRTNLGNNHLKYGVAYYPYVQTTIVQNQDVDYTNLGGGAALSKLSFLSGNAHAAGILAQIAKPVQGGPSPKALQQSLIIASPDYGKLRNGLLKKLNTLPVSSAMAGVYTSVDHSQGVWKAPANVSLTAVSGTTVNVTDAAQQDLNVDPSTGKSVNAIRKFPGKGVLVWGARTLDGNSEDWRYVSVRRTMIMIEQSLSLALNDYVFAENDATTWSTVTAEVTQFLHGLWAQGALQGPTPADAFSVSVGEGKTMTAEDILAGRMIINVKVAVNHPIEFVELVISQEMQKG